MNIPRGYEAFNAAWANEMNTFTSSPAWHNDIHLQKQELEMSQVQNRDVEEKWQEEKTYQEQFVKH